MQTTTSHQWLGIQRSLVFVQFFSLDCVAELLLITSEKHSKCVFGVYSNQRETEESWIPVSFVCRPLGNTVHSQVVCCKISLLGFDGTAKLSMSQTPSEMHLHQFILSCFFPALLGTKSYLFFTEFSCLYGNSVSV